MADVTTTNDEYLLVEYSTNRSLSWTFGVMALFPAPTCDTPLHQCLRGQHKHRHTRKPRGHDIVALDGFGFSYDTFPGSGIILAAYISARRCCDRNYKWYGECTSRTSDKRGPRINHSGAPTITATINPSSKIVNHPLNGPSQRRSSTFVVASCAGVHETLMF